ncbi:hypothetical protein CC86DRAFT_431000, partial [Ophiobolus disseminans]
HLRPIYHKATPPSPNHIFINPNFFPNIYLGTMTNTSPDPPTSISFPRPTYKRPYTIDPADPVNKLLVDLRQSMIEHALSIKQMSQNIQQETAEYETWKRKKWAELHMQMGNPNKMEDNMREAYDGMLRMKWQEALEKGQLVLKYLQTFLDCAKEVLEVT